MRNSLLSGVRKMTSSRQSPKKSADKTGVALVPLFEVAPSAVSKVSSVSLVQFHLEMRLRSSSSRKRSPSHHIAKFAERGALPMRSPVQVRNPEGPPHISAPG